MDHQFDQYWSAGFKAGIQHTGSAEFETTSEPFRFDHKNEVIFGLNLNLHAGGQLMSAARSLLKDDRLWPIATYCAAARTWSL
jgi:hypothetical protein